MTSGGPADGPGGPARPAVPGTGGLLAVHAHPDDETLSTGALLAAWAAAGRPVTVVTCTRGERGEVIPPELEHLSRDPHALAAHREGELALAVAALGVTDQVFLDRVPVGPGGGSARAYEDSGMTWLGPGRAGPGTPAAAAFVRVPVDEAAQRLAAVICDRRPDVVVTYEPGGGYGHPDHVHAHRVTQAAVAAAAAGGHRVPVLLWAAVDATALRAARAELTAADAAPGLAPEPIESALPSAAAATARIAVRVHVPPVLDRVARAMAAHATQVQGVRSWHDRAASAGCFALSNAVLQPILREESYVLDPAWTPGTNAWPPHVSSGIA